MMNIKLLSGNFFQEKKVKMRTAKSKIWGRKVGEIRDTKTPMSPTFLSHISPIGVSISTFCVPAINFLIAVWYKSFKHWLYNEQFSPPLGLYTILRENAFHFVHFVCRQRLVGFEFCSWNVSRWTRWRKSNREIMIDGLLTISLLRHSCRTQRHDRGLFIAWESSRSLEPAIRAWSLTLSIAFVML